MLGRYALYLGVIGVFVGIHIANIFLGSFDDSNVTPTQYEDQPETRVTTRDDLPAPATAVSAPDPRPYVAEIVEHPALTTTNPLTWNDLALGLIALRHLTVDQGGTTRTIIERSVGETADNLSGALASYRTEMATAVSTDTLTVGDNNLTVLENGNVGIKVSVPRVSLEIFNDATAFNDLPGDQSSSLTALIIRSDPTSTGSRPGIVQYGLRTPGSGIAYSMQSSFIGSSEDNVVKAAELGVYGDVYSSAEDHRVFYMYLSAMPGAGWNDNTLKIDSTNRVGVGLSGTNRPYAVLTVGGNASSTSNWQAVGRNFAVAANTITDSYQSGTFTTRAANSFGRPTFASVNPVTVTNAATLYIDNAPLAGTNTTITNPHALHVAAGNAYFGGNVGIGETAPGSKLSVSGGATVGAGYDTTAAPTNGLLVEGNVGIGTSTPGGTLDIYQSPLNTGLESAVLNVYGDTNHLSKYLMNIRNSSTNVFTVRGDGKIGIGTVSPDHSLDVVNSSNDNLSGFRIRSANLQQSSTYGFEGVKASRNYFIHTGGSENDAVTVLDTGNVGIGTTTPSAKLSVSGDIYADGNLTVSGITATTSIAAPYFTATDAAATSTFAGGLNVGSGGLVYDSATGRVGVGITTPNTAFDIVSTNVSQFRIGYDAITDAVWSLGASGNNEIRLRGLEPSFSIAAPGAQADAVPTMTGQSTPSGNATASSYIDVRAPWKAFNDSNSDNTTDPWHSGGGAPQWLQYQFDFPKVINRYTIAARPGGDSDPRDWTFLGSNDGLNWTVLDTQTDQNLAGGEMAEYPVANSTSYTHYRLNVTASNGVYVIVGEMELMEATSFASRLSIDTAGMIGIGTTTPSAKLSVSGDIYADGNLTVSGITATTSIAAPYFTATDAAATSTFAGGLNVGSGGLVYDSATGNVGIGTSSPLAHLEVSAGGSTGGNAILISSGSGSVGDLLSVSEAGTVTVGVEGSGILSVPGLNADTQQFGLGAIAGGQYSLAVGTNANTGSGQRHVVLGSYARILDTADGNGVAIGYSADITGTGRWATVIGADASANNPGGTAIGYNTTANERSVAIGLGASAGYRSVAIGEASVVSDSYGIAIGRGSEVTGRSGIAIGTLAQADFRPSLTFGYQAVATASRQVVFGSSNINDGTFKDFYFGGGITSSSPLDITFQSTSGSGVDTAGSSFTIAAGQGTGSGIGGDLIFQTAAAGTSGSDLNSLTERFRITNTGNVGIGDATPASMLTVGASDAFQVTSAGRVLANAGASGAGNLAYSFVGDTDTGIYRSAADEMRFQTAGSDRLTIDASGKVGIGIVAPTTKLEVIGNLQVGESTNNNTGNYSAAIGMANTITGDTSLAVGRQNNISGGGNVYSIVAGRLNSLISGNSNAIFGYGNSVTGSYNFVTGYSSSVTGSYSSALGNYVNVNADRSFGFGQRIDVNAPYAVGFGLEPRAGGSATWPDINGTSTIAFFMGDQSSVDLNDENLFAILGGKMIIDSNSPATNLSPDAVLELQKPASGAIFGVTGATANDLFVIDNDGNVGIATTTPTETLSVDGTVGFHALTGATGAGSLCLSSDGEVVYNATSDACLPSLRDTKSTINPLAVDALDTITALEAVSFIYNDSDGRTRYGFIAEDVALVDPLLATYDADGILSGIDDRSMLAVVVKGVQELWEYVTGRFDAQEEQIEAYAEKIEDYEEQMHALAERIRELESREGIIYTAPAPEDEVDNEHQENADQGADTPEEGAADVFNEDGDAAADDGVLEEEPEPEVAPETGDEDTAEDDPEKPADDEAGEEDDAETGSSEETNPQ